MTRKRSDKEKRAETKSAFFGDHLEVKPGFMQRPKSLDEVMAEVFSKPPASESSVDQSATVVQNMPVVNSATDVSYTTQANNATVAQGSTAVEVATIVPEIPVRLRAEVERLKGITEEEWQVLPAEAGTGPDYWHGYSEAWHWIEDRIFPHLEKDLKLTLRRCYRKAFGSQTAGGRFFTGQTILAREVGLSKRRIQDILEVFNLLGWVLKVGHYNKGGRKGTDYEMRLPPEAIGIFQRIKIKP